MWERKKVIRVTQVRLLPLTLICKCSKVKRDTDGNSDTCKCQVRKRFMSCYRFKGPYRND